MDFCKEKISRQLSGVFRTTTTQADKKDNQRISSSKATVENVIRSVKIFSIIAEKIQIQKKTIYSKS